MTYAFMANFALMLLSLGLAASLVLALRRHAPRLGLVDAPSWRKHHVGAIPLVGGLAMFLAVAAALALTGAVERVPLGVAMGALLITALGVVEDVHALAPRLRLGIEAIAVFMATAASGVILTDVGRLIGGEMVYLGLLGVPFTIFGVVGVVNAVNLSDGMDGLAGGIALTVMVALGVVLLFLPNELAAPAIGLLVASAGALVAFLYFNMRTPWRARASVFMGDAGSLLLGFMLGWFLTFVCSLPVENRLTPVSALWMLIVPLFDTVSCMLRRKLRGRSPLRADAYHVHHLLNAWGMTPRATVAALVAVNAMGAAIGVITWRAGVPESWMFAAIVVAFGLYFAFIQQSWQRITSRQGRGLVLVRARANPTGPSYLPAAG